MGLRCATYTVLFALAACGSSSAASDGPSTASQPARASVAACGPRDGHTLAASRSARAYSLHGDVYGCATDGHHNYLLGAGSRSIRERRAGPIAVAGADAAYGLTSFGVDTVMTEVVVRRLSDGRQLRALPATTKTLPESFQTVDAVVVKSDGAVAWISSVSSVITHGAATVEVLRADSRGETVLDSAGSIDPRSLRLSGSNLTWRDASKTRAATLR